MAEYVTDTQALIKFMFFPLGLEILESAAEITDIPELHDRLIAATTRYLDLPIITNDPQIINSRFVKNV